MSVNYSARSGGIIEYITDFLYMTVCCVLSLESPHRGDSNEYTQYTIFNIKKKIILNFPQICSHGIFFQGTQLRVRNSQSKRVSRVRAIEVLLYDLLICSEKISCTMEKISATTVFVPENVMFS